MTDGVSIAVHLPLVMLGLSLRFCGAPRVRLHMSWNAGWRMGPLSGLVISRHMRLQLMKPNIRFEFARCARLLAVEPGRWALTWSAIRYPSFARNLLSHIELSESIRCFKNERTASAGCTRVLSSASTRRRCSQAMGSSYKSAMRSLPDKTNERGFVRVARPASMASSDGTNDSR